MHPQRGILPTCYAQFAQHCYFKCFLYGQDAVGQLEIVQIVQHTAIPWHSGFAGVYATGFAQVVDKAECLQQHIDGCCWRFQFCFYIDNRYFLGQATDGFLCQIFFNGRDQCNDA